MTERPHQLTHLVLGDPPDAWRTAGFDVDGAQAAFEIPDGVRPIAVVAVGTLGDYSEMGEEIAERDGRPRERLPLNQIAFGGRWGIPLG